MPVRKIAAVTDDGHVLSNHFGMARLYIVFEVEDGLIMHREMREKPHHAVHPDHSQPHDHSQLHEDMFAPVADCQVLMVGGMGEGAFNRAAAAGLEVVMVRGEIDPALHAYLRGGQVTAPGSVRNR